MIYSKHHFGVRCIIDRRCIAVAGQSRYCDESATYHQKLELLLLWKGAINAITPP